MKAKQLRRTAQLALLHHHHASAGAACSGRRHGSVAEAGEGITRHTRARSVGAPAIVADYRRLRLGHSRVQFHQGTFEAKGSGASSGDRLGHAACRAGVVMTVSYSTGVSRPSAACRRRRW